MQMLAMAVQSVDHAGHSGRFALSQEAPQVQQLNIRCDLSQMNFLAVLSSSVAFMKIKNEKINKTIVGENS